MYNPEQKEEYAGSLGFDVTDKGFAHIFDETLVSPEIINHGEYRKVNSKLVPSQMLQKLCMQKTHNNKTHNNKDELGIGG